MRIQKHIAIALQQAIRESHLSREEYSEELGIAKSSLQNYLTGNSNPRADTIEYLAGKLHITPEELISGTRLDPVFRRPEDCHPLVAPLIRDVLSFLQAMYTLSDRLYGLDAETK